MLLQRVVPARVPGEHEVVQPAEQPERDVPGVAGKQLVDPAVAREPSAERRVERRAAVAVRRLPLEDLGAAAYFAAASAAFAVSASSPNFAGSATARSASTFRSSSTSAAFRPEMN